MENRRKKIGIMGGTFDPIHVGHLILGEKAYEQLGLDKILFMPAGNPPHKRNRKGRASDEQRVEMVNLAIQGNPHFELSLIEMNAEGFTYTYRTLETLKKQNPDTDYYFIIGADMVEYLPKWHRIDELIEMVQFVGVQRPKYKAGTSYPVIWVDVPLMDISSSAVRAYIKKDRTPNFMVPQSVLAYIKKAGLYK